MVLTNTFMKKHLTMYNKFVRDELLVRGLSKMNKEQIEKEFNQRFKLYTGSKSGRKGYIPKEVQGYSPEYETKDFFKLYEDNQPKKKPVKKAEPKQSLKTKTANELFDLEQKLRDNYFSKIKTTKARNILKYYPIEETIGGGSKSDTYFHLKDRIQEGEPRKNLSDFLSKISKGGLDKKVSPAEEKEALNRLDKLKKYYEGLNLKEYFSEAERVKKIYKKEKGNSFKVMSLLNPETGKKKNVFVTAIEELNR